MAYPRTDSTRLTVTKSIYAGQHSRYQYARPGSWFKSQLRHLRNYFTRQRPVFGNLFDNVIDRVGPSADGLAWTSGFAPQVAVRKRQLTAIKF
jgi:hypothetical protein